MIGKFSHFFNLAVDSRVAGYGVLDLKFLEFIRVIEGTMAPKKGTCEE